MERCESGEAFVAFSRQFDLHSAPIVRADTAPDESRYLAPRNQRYHTVVFRLQALGELAHSRPLATRKALDLEHQLVLQRCYAVLPRHLLAEAQKTPKLVAEMRELFNIRL